MSKRNFLLGKGERLTAAVVVKGGGAEKVPAYTVAEARRRLTPMISTTSGLILTFASPGGWDGSANVKIVKSTRINVF